MFKPKLCFTAIKNEEGENLLHYFCRTGDLSELLSLQDSNDENRHCLMEYNEEMEQCVHIVAAKHIDSIEILKLIKLWGADINGKELKGGDTPLHIAVRVKNYALAEWLCQQADVNKEMLNNDYMTPYHIAFVNRDDKMMNVLKQNGAHCRIPHQSENNSECDEEYEPFCKSPKY